MNVKKRGGFGEKVGTWLISDTVRWGRGLGGMYVALPASRCRSTDLVCGESFCLVEHGHY